MGGHAPIPAGVGQVLFAATFCAVGVLGLSTGHLPPAWEPVPASTPAQHPLALLCATLSLACGIGLLWRRTALWCARALLAALPLWLLVFRLPVIYRHPLSAGAWEQCAETTVIVAGAWTAYARLAGQWDRQHLGFAGGDGGARLARLLYGAALLVFGISHFAYLRETAALVPAWLPWPTGWASFTGCTYLAAGAAVLIGVRVRAATALAALQMGLFTLLVWAPILAAGSTDPFQWSEGIISWVLTVSAWVVADDRRRVG